VSYLNSKVNKVTGQPTVYFFLWQQGKHHNKMRNLGNLGGSASLPNDMNSNGQFVGLSNLKGDKVYHPTLWNGKQLLDLGTLGGDNGAAQFVNDSGWVVGSADLTGGQIHHAFLWRPGGRKLVDLSAEMGGTCSSALGINSKRQIVGRSGNCQGVGYASLWESGRVFNLNTLVSPTAAHLDLAQNINDSGAIYAQGIVNGKVHEFVLIPKH
jgi:probable HAF family extracellular repeat protein